MNFDANIVGMKQDKNCLLLALDNDSLVSFNWHTNQVVEKWTEFSATPLSCIAINSDEKNNNICIVTGTREGDITVL